MIDRAPPATRQARLLARLIGAIYGITEALGPVIQGIVTTPVRPWQERMRFSNRFYAIIRELLILTVRIKPGILSDNPVFAPTRPRAAHAAQSSRRDPTPRPTPSRAAPITPRQLAQRLTLLLYRLECLAAEAGAALTGRYHRNAAIARAIAGCNACPPAPSRHQRTTSPAASWERAG